MKKRIVTFNSIFGAVSAALYIITKIAAIEFAVLWLIIDYLRLSKTAAIVAAVLLTIPCLWASYKVSLMAYDAETDPVNNEE